MRLGHFDDSFERVFHDPVLFVVFLGLSISCFLVALAFIIPILQDLAKEPSSSVARFLLKIRRIRLAREFWVSLRSKNLDGWRFLLSSVRADLVHRSLILKGALDRHAKLREETESCGVEELARLGYEEDVLAEQIRLRYKKFNRLLRRAKAGFPYCFDDKTSYLDFLPKR